MNKKSKKNIYEEIFKGNSKLNEEDKELLDQVWKEAINIFEKSYNDTRDIIFKHFNASKNEISENRMKAGNIEAITYLIVNSKLSSALIANMLVSNITSNTNIPLETL